LSTNNFWFEPPTQPLPRPGGQHSLRSEEPTPLFDQTIQTLAPAEPQPGSDCPPSTEFLVDSDSPAGQAILDLQARANAAGITAGPVGREVLALVHRWLHAVGIGPDDASTSTDHHSIYGE
jgi:hypothetical protein